MLVIAGTALALAQDRSNESKNELAATIGRSFISNQGVPNSGLPNSNVHFGPSLSFEVNYVRTIRALAWGDLSVEVPAIFNPDEDLNYGANQVPEQYSSVFVTPSARLRVIPDLAFSPWISFGAGVGHFQASRTLVFSGINTGSRIKTTAVLQGGVGMDVRLPIRSLKFRIEARDDWSGEAPINVNTGKSRQHNYYVGGGIVYRF